MWTSPLLADLFAALHAITLGTVIEVLRLVLITTLSVAWGRHWQGARLRARRGRTNGAPEGV